MSVQAELDKRNGRLEWFLCVEGIGWLANESDFSDGVISSGFVGNVFVTKDFEGTLASILGCTVNPGLILPSVAISESFNPMTMEYQKGNLLFAAQDRNDVLRNTIRPLDATGRVAKTATGGPLIYTTNTVVIDETTAPFAQNDVIWICGREAVKLGTRNAGGAPLIAYASSSRGYLGTPRGRPDSRPTGLDQMGWAEGSDVRDYNRFWWDRKVMLFLHVPGEALSEVKLVYTGRLRGVDQTKQALVWELPTVHDMAFYTSRVREQSVRNIVGPNEFIAADNWSSSGWNDQNVSGNGALIGDFSIGLSPMYADYVDRRIRIEAHGDHYEHLALAYHYHYRRAPGGTSGVELAALTTPTTPQAYQDSLSRYKVGALVSFGGDILRVKHKAPDRGSSAYDYRTVIAQVWNRGLGMNNLSLLQQGGEVRYLLDNVMNDGNTSRFTVPKSGGGSRVSRNVIDLALMFLTSMNNEFYRADATGTSTTTDVDFAGTPFTELGNNFWTGFAVHAVEGSNLGEARVITGSDNDGLTVGTAFTNAPAAGNEYQVRNTIYDTLPIGWGLGIPNWKINVTSWEDIRDRYLSEAQVGSFAIGDEERIDLWEMLVENIFIPFGILPYLDRSTGRLSARYIGEALPTGIDETYTTIGVTDMLGVGDVRTMQRAPAGSIDLEVRGAGVLPMNNVGAFTAQTRFINPLATGPYAKATLRSRELDAVFGATALSKYQVKAHFNDVDTMAWLAARFEAHLRREANPPPEVTIPLNASWFLKLTVGQLVEITDTTKWQPINPYTHTRGWSSLLARVVDLNAVVGGDKPGVEARFRLLRAGNQARIAPAANVASKGADGGGDFVQCNSYDFASDPSGTADWARFGNGDRIELRDKTGAVKEGPEVVLGTPAAGKVYIVGTWASSIAAGDYITFAAWSASNTAAMNNYVALADAAETLGGANDPAKDYG